jgi:hypothetical protein
VNERAVNIKQNQSHHSGRLPEFQVFRENYQDGTGLQILGALASRRRVVRKGLASETPALPGSVAAVGHKLSDCAFRHRRDNAGLIS